MSEARISSEQLEVGVHSKEMAETQHWGLKHI